MKLLNMGIAALFCAILVFVWIMSERADPVMLELPRQPAVGGSHVR